MKTYTVRDSSFGINELPYELAIETIRDWYCDVASWRTGTADSNCCKAVVSHINSVPLPPDNGDLFDLDLYAGRVCEAVAYALDYSAWAGHGRYLVKASEIAGLNLRVYLDEETKEGE